jgi:hypothetical protein
MQSNSDDDFFGDECDLCPSVSGGDLLNSNAIVEKMYEVDPLSDACDPVPLEIPEPVRPLPVFVDKELLEQGDGEQSDDLNRISSSTFLGVEDDENQTVERASTFRWCDCVTKEGEALSIKDCVGTRPEALCTSFQPLRNEDWKRLSLTPLGNAPSPNDNGWIERSFTSGQKRDEAQWTWNWFEDFSSGNAEMFEDNVGLEYGWAALLSHVNPPSQEEEDFTSVRDKMLSKPIRDVYTLAVKGPIDQGVSLIPPLKGCHWADCRRSWIVGKITDCPMCIGPGLSLFDKLANPFVIVDDGIDVMAVRTDGTGFSITDQVSLVFRSALQQIDNYNWLKPVEPESRLNAVNSRIRSAYLEKDSNSSPTFVLSSDNGTLYTSDDPVIVLLGLDEFGGSTPSEPGDLVSKHGVLSGVVGDVYIVGNEQGQAKSEIWRYNLHTKSWFQVQVSPGCLRPSADIFSIAYDSMRSTLYVLDNKKTGFGLLKHNTARLLAIDMSTGKSRLMASWPRVGVFNRLSIGVDSDHSLVLIGANRAGYVAWRFRVKTHYLKLLGAKIGIGNLLDHPFMVHESLAAPVRRGGKVHMDRFGKGAFGIHKQCMKL